MRIRNAMLSTLIAIVGGLLSSAQQPRVPASPSVLAGTSVYSKLPLVFEANHDQTDGKVHFLSRGVGYTAFMTDGNLTLSLKQGSGINAVSTTAHPGNSALQLRLVGAKTNPEAVGENQQAGVVNYFIGNDPSQWRRNLPTFGKVRYKSVYPGVDLVYYGSHQQLEYDFVLSSGIDPGVIRFEILGASQVRLNNLGELLLTTPSGDLRFQIPIVYQEILGNRVPVKGAYEVEDPTHVGFKVSGYDQTKPLVIDPVLVYSSYLGGSGIDQPTGIAVDNSGNVYVEGYTDSANFPLTTLGTIAPNANHVFVAKLDPSGSNLIYADYIGGNYEDYGVALAVDSAGEVFVTGSTESSNFPTVNAYQAQQLGPYTGFLSKISADGSSLLYSTYLGGSTIDQPTSIAIDSSGEAHVAGYTFSQDFPVANAFQASASPNQAGLYGSYGFLTKFASSGSSLIYSTYFAGNSNVVQGCGASCWPNPYNAINAVSVDANDSAYVTGDTNTYNFPVTAGTYLTSNTTQQDAYVGFVSKFNSAGSLSYSTYFYSSGGNPVTPSALAVDNAGSAYITGIAYSDGTFPITSTSICDPGVYGYACSYAFVTKFDPAASTLLYSTFLGPNNYASPIGISIDANDDAYVVAASQSAAFGIVNGIEPYSNGMDTLVVEIDPSATTELFATFLGGTGDDFPSGIALDSNSNIYLTGTTSSTDYPTTQGAFQPSTGGSTDGYIAKIGAAAAPSASVNPGSLQFGVLNIGSSSPTQSVLLRNMGSSTLSINSIETNGDFSETDDCGNSVGAAGQCTMTVTFTPTATGARAGAVVITDNAAGSPQQIILGGTGAGPNAQLTPSSLAFPTIVLGASSPAQTVTLTNNGTEALSISSIQTAGDFAETNNCSTTLVFGASCVISIEFTPSANGTRNGSLSITDNAIPALQTIPLTGVGTNVSVTLIPSNLSFSALAVGTVSATQTVTLTNTGGSVVNISGIQLTGDYLQTNNCPTVLAAASGCAISVQFKPTASGARAGTISVNDSAQGSPQMVGLSGTGSDFSLSASPDQDTINSGSSATYTVNVASLGGAFSNSVGLSCSGVPSTATCKFSPSAVIPGASGTSSQLTITTTGSSARGVLPRPSANPSLLAVWMPLQGLGIIGLALVSPKKRVRKLFVITLLTPVIVGLLLMLGCAGGTGIASQSGSGQTPGTNYTITISGTSGTLQHSVAVGLTVK